MPGWDALPDEVKDVVWTGIIGGVGAGRPTGQPAGWWADKLGLDEEEGKARLEILRREKILEVDGGGRYYFSAKGNVWAAGYVEARRETDNPFGQPDLLMVATSATTAHAVIEAARSLCPNLDFDRNCFWYAKQCELPAPFQELARALLVLDAMAAAAVDGNLGMPPEKWVTQFCFEKGFGGLRFKPKDNSTEHSPRRKVKINGVEKTMHEHFSMGSGPPHQTVTVYFIRYPENSRRITVGYCGPHL